MDELEEKLIQIKTKNNQELRNQLICEYQPFILSEVSKKIGRYVYSEKDEVFSVGMIAFDEAITRYEKSRGKFLSYAALVISSRVLDYIKKNKAYTDTVILDGKLINDQVDDKVNEALLDDIKVFVQKLDLFDIDLDKLADNSPKHKDARKETTRLGIEFSKDTPIVNFLYSKFRLPITKVVTQYRCSKKTVERFKQYIIAVMIIMIEQLDSIKGFLSGGNDFNE